VTAELLDVSIIIVVVSVLEEIVLNVVELSVAVLDSSVFVYNPELKLLVPV